MTWWFPLKNNVFLCWAMVRVLCWNRYMELRPGAIFHCSSLFFHYFHCFSIVFHCFWLCFTIFSLIFTVVHWHRAGELNRGISYYKRGIVHCKRGIVCSETRNFEFNMMNFATISTARQPQASDFPLCLLHIYTIFTVFSLCFCQFYFMFTLFHSFFAVFLILHVYSMFLAAMSRDGIMSSDLH